MSNVWERYEDMEGMTKDAVEEAKAKAEPLPAGTYKVRLERFTDKLTNKDIVLGASESNNGNPMVKGMFRVVEGEHKDKVVFYNQVLLVNGYPDFTAQNIAKVISLLSGILGEEIEYTGLGDLADLLESVNEGVEFDMDLSYTTNKKGDTFPNISVVKDIEDLEIDGDIDEDIAF